MTTLICATSALAVATIYYVWRFYHQQMEQQDKVVRERVTYMLWVMANNELER